MSFGNSSFLNDPKSSSNTSYSNGTFLIMIGLGGPLYVIIFVLALVGNILALLACYKNYRVTTSILLVYIASLASADLLFTVLTLFEPISYLLGEWIGGKPFCKILGFLTETSYSASILTLVAISYERFRSISSRSLARSKRIETRAIIVKMVWIVSVVLCAPLLYAYDDVINKKTGKLECNNYPNWGDKGTQTYYALQTVVLFLLPLGIMVWAHLSIFCLLRSHSKDNRQTTVSRSQRKTTKMLAVVTLVFFCCWTPFITWRVLFYFLFQDYEGEMIVWRFCQLLIFLNSGINPFLYCFVSGQFRSSFKEFMKCNCKKTPWRYSRKPRSRSNTLHVSNVPE